MLSNKPWKLDAVVRLLLGVFICIFAGSLAMVALHRPTVPAKADWKFYPLASAAWVCLGGALVVIRKPWNLENLVRRVTLWLAFFYAGVLFGAWAQKYAGPPGSPVPSVWQLVVTALSFQGATLILVVFFLREHRIKWPDAFGLQHNWVNALLLGLMIACIFLPLGWTLQRVSAEVMTHLPHWKFKPEEQLPVQTLRLADSWSDRLVLGFVTILLAPMAEEVLFRGILYPWIRQAGFPRLALWGTALLFAAMHLNAVTFVPLFLLAIVLALLYQHTDNLLAPFTAHALFNGFNFALLYLLDTQPLGKG